MNLTKKIVSLFAIVALMGSTVSASNYVESSEGFSSELMDYITEFSVEDFDSVIEDNSVKLLDGTLDFENATKDVRNRYNFFALREYQKYNSRLSKSDKIQLKALIKYFNENYKTYNEKRVFFAGLGNRIEKFESAMDKKMNSLSCVWVCKAQTRLAKARYGNLLKALRYHNAIVLLRQSTNEVLVQELPEVPMTEEEKLEAEKIIDIYKKAEVKLIKEFIGSAESFIQRLPEMKETGNLEMNLDANFGTKFSALLNFKNYTALQKGLNSKVNGDFELKGEWNGESINLKGKMSAIVHNLVSYYNFSNLEYSSTDDTLNAGLEMFKKVFADGTYITDNHFYKKLAEFDVNSVEKLVKDEEYKVVGKRNGYYEIKLDNLTYLLSTNGNEYQLKNKRDKGEMVIKFDNDKINSIDFKVESGLITFDQTKGLIMKLDTPNGIEVNASLSKNRSWEYGNFSFRLYKAPNSSSERPLYVTVTINDYNLDVNAQIPSYSTKYSYSEEEGYVLSTSLDFLAKLKLKGVLSNTYDLNSLSGNFDIVGNDGEKMFNADINYSKGFYLRSEMKGKLWDDATIDGKININYSQRQFDNGLIDIKILDPNNIANKFIVDIKMAWGKITWSTSLTSEWEEIFKVDTKGTYSFNKMSVENDYTVNVPMFTWVVSYTWNFDFSYDNSQIDRLYNVLFDLSQWEIKMIDFKIKGNYRQEKTKVEPITAPTKVKTTQELQMQY